MSPSSPQLRTALFQVLLLSGVASTCYFETVAARSSSGLSTLEGVQKAENAEYYVPAFTIADLLAGRRQDDLAAILGTTGLIALTGLDGAFPTDSKAALTGLCQCAQSDVYHQDQSPLLSIDGTDYALLSDGLTTRTTLATATMGSVPLPLPQDQISTLCGNSRLPEKMESLRDHVAHASQAFTAALDRLIVGSTSPNSVLHTQSPFAPAISSMTASVVDHDFDKYDRANQIDARKRSLLRTTYGVDFHNIKSIIQSSSNLEHFHVYSKSADKRTSLNGESENSLEVHTDAGLFLAFVPAVSCNAENNGKDTSFLFRDHNVDDMIKRAVFPDSSVAIMLGAGVENWIQSPELLPLRATRHAVWMKNDSRRAWYGMMHLVPQDAIIQQLPMRTFADMKRSVVVSNKARQYGDSVSQVIEDDISIGCGIAPSSTSSSSVEENFISNSMPLLTRKKSRSRLQIVGDGSACNNSTNFYCWMSCLDIPDATHSEGHINEGQSLYCLDPSILASTGNKVSAAVTPCTQAGVPGSAMNSACVGYWQATAPGVPSQTVNYNSTPPSNAGQPFCYGATSMLMQGFEIKSTTCLVYLLPQWVLSTRAKLAGAYAGTLILGVVLEGIIRSRRFLLLALPVGWKRLVASTLAYGMQLATGYLVMLVVMTYSVPLFVLVILGLMLGHVLFNSGVEGRCNKEGVGEGGECVPDGATPCCQNDLCLSSENLKASSTSNFRDDPQLLIAESGKPYQGLTSVNADSVSDGHTARDSAEPDDGVNRLYEQAEACCCTSNTEGGCDEV